MVFGKLFGKKEDSTAPIAGDIRLADLQPGYLVDYNMETWQCVARHRYDYDGDSVDEWELQNGKKRLWLERGEDDGEYWGLAAKIRMGEIEQEVARDIREDRDPPKKINFDGKTWLADESGAGYFFEDCGNESEGFLFWTYADDDDDHFVTVEQWGENEFEAAAGAWVEPWQFDNILPGEL